MMYVCVYIYLYGFVRVHLCLRLHGYLCLFESVSISVLSMCVSSVLVSVPQCVSPCLVRIHVFGKGMSEGICISVYSTVYL